MSKHTMPSPSMIAFGELCLLLHDPRPRLQMELQELIGVTNATMTRMMRTLRTRRLIYVESWRRCGRTWQPVWKWGHKQFDALKPRALTTAEHSRNYRLRKTIKASEVQRQALRERQP